MPGDGFMTGGMLAVCCGFKAADLQLGELECAGDAVKLKDNLSQSHLYLMML